jgi:hypothetical protein
MQPVCCVLREELVWGPAKRSCREGLQICMSCVAEQGILCTCVSLWLYG